MYRHERTRPSMPGQQSRRARSLAWMQRIAPALGVFFLAPLTAEYLIGYDTSTGDVGALLFGLAFLGPLYGGAALLIREVARRAGRGWPTMILLSCAFGVFQPALIDHSLFNTSYRDIDHWQAMLRPTSMPWLGISAAPALNFILGHVIWSISVPIALVETLVPRRRTTPWLGTLGLAIITMLYILASALIFLDHVESEQFLPSVPQMIGASAVVIVCVVAAFSVGKQSRPTITRSALHPWLVGIGAFMAVSLPYIVDTVLAFWGIMPSFESSWAGVTLSSMLLAGLAITVARWSRWAGWGAGHRLALVGGALLTRVWLAFLVEPLGDVPFRDKLIHNTLFALGALVLLGVAACQANRTHSSE